MSDISTRIKDYLNSKKPTESKPNIIITTKSELEQAREEFNNAWEDFLYEYKALIKIAKYMVFTFALISILAGVSIFSIANKCYLDDACRKEITRVNE